MKRYHPRALPFFPVILYAWRRKIVNCVSVQSIGVRKAVFFFTRICATSNYLYFFSHDDLMRCMLKVISISYREPCRRMSGTGRGAFSTSAAVGSTLLGSGSGSATLEQSRSSRSRTPIQSVTRMRRVEPQDNTRD